MAQWLHSDNQQWLSRSTAPETSTFTVPKSVKSRVPGSKTCQLVYCAKSQLAIRDLQFPRRVRRNILCILADFLASHCIYILSWMEWVKGRFTAALKFAVSSIYQKQMWPKSKKENKNSYLEFRNLQVYVCFIQPHGMDFAVLICMLNKGHQDQRQLEISNA